eukprot:GHVL01003965.1.p1 GENE.GHVL01003965.1~~GHVL01003965.1.p1  ORF type:complete len:862 (+),score=116.65 GHVL01003965.1:108-2588(+)
MSYKENIMESPEVSKKLRRKSSTPSLLNQKQKSMIRSASVVTLNRQSFSRTALGIEGSVSSNTSSRIRSMRQPGTYGARRGVARGGVAGGGRTGTSSRGNRGPIRGHDKSLEKKQNNFIINDSIKREKNKYVKPVNLIKKNMSLESENIKNVNLNKENDVNSEEDLIVYRDLFDEVISRDRIFGDLLQKIKNAYESFIKKIQEESNNNLNSNRSSYGQPKTNLSAVTTSRLKKTTLNEKISKNNKNISPMYKGKIGEGSLSTISRVMEVSPSWHASPNIAKKCINRDDKQMKYNGPNRVNHDRHSRVEDVDAHRHTDNEKKTTDNRHSHIDHDVSESSYIQNDDGRGHSHIQHNDVSGHSHIQHNEGGEHSHIQHNEGGGQSHIKHNDVAGHSHIKHNDRRANSHIKDNDGGGHSHIQHNDGGGHSHIQHKDRRLKLDHAREISQIKQNDCRGHGHVNHDHADHDDDHSHIDHNYGSGRSCLRNSDTSERSYIKHDDRGHSHRAHDDGLLTRNIDHDDGSEHSRVDNEDKSCIGHDSHSRIEHDKHSHIEHIGHKAHGHISRDDEHSHISHDDGHSRIGHDDGHSRIGHDDGHSHISHDDGHSHIGHDAHSHLSHGDGHSRIGHNAHSQIRNDDEHSHFHDDCREQTIIGHDDSGNSHLFKTSFMQRNNSRLSLLTDSPFYPIKQSNDLMVCESFETSPNNYTEDDNSSLLDRTDELSEFSYLMPEPKFVANNLKRPPFVPPIDLSAVHRDMLQDGSDNSDFEEEIDHEGHSRISNDDAHSHVDQHSHTGHDDHSQINNHRYREHDSSDFEEEVISAEEALYTLEA